MRFITQLSKSSKAMVFWRLGVVITTKKMTKRKMEEDMIITITTMPMSTHKIKVTVMDIVTDMVIIIIDYIMFFSYYNKFFN